MHGYNTLIFCLQMKQPTQALLFLTMLSLAHSNLSPLLSLNITFKKRNFCWSERRCDLRLHARQLPYT